MPDVPELASKKRKVTAGAPSSSAPPPPKKKQKTDSGGASFSKPAMTRSQLATPSARGFVRSNIPASAPPRIKPTQQDVEAGSSTQPLPPPLRRRTRSTITVSSRRRVYSPDIGDDTPPPVMALRRSSSGRVITSTAKVVAANDLGKPFGSAKPRSSRQKRKLSPAPYDVIELYSSGEELRRGTKSKVLLAKRRKKRKAAEVIDLCSDDEPSPSPAKMPIVRTCVDDDIVTILSSDDDKRPTRPTHDDEPLVSQTPMSSLKKRRGRKNAAAGAQKEEEPVLTIASSPAAQPLTQLDRSATPRSPPCPPAVASTDVQNLDSVIGDVDIYNIQQGNTETGQRSVFFTSDLPRNVEDSVFKRTISITPPPECIHDDEEPQRPGSQLLRDHDVNPGADSSTYPNHRELQDTDALPLPTEPLSVSAIPHLTLLTPEPCTQVEIPGKDIFGNAVFKDHSENGNGVPPARETTPLFLPPLDDEEPGVGVHGTLYASFSWKEHGDAGRASPLRDDTAPDLRAPASNSLTGTTRKTNLRNDPPEKAYQYSTHGGSVPEFELMEISTPSQYTPQPDNALIEGVPTTPESKLVVATYAKAEGMNSHQLAEGKESVEEGERPVNEGYSQEGLDSMLLKHCKEKSVYLTKEPADGDTGNARDTVLHDTILQSSIPTNGGTEQAGDIHPTDDSTTNPRLVRLFSSREVDADELESLPSPMSHRQSLEKAYAEELLRCRYQFHRTPSYVNYNITYPSDPSTLLSHLRLHTPGFFSQSFVLPTDVKEKEVYVEGRQEEKETVITQPAKITRFPGSESTDMEVFIASNQPGDNIVTPIADIAIDDTIPTSSSSVCISQALEAQADAHFLLEKDSHSESTPAFLPSEGEDEVTMEVTAEFLENNPTLASALLESKMFMDILRNVRQDGDEAEVSDGQAKISDEPICTLNKALDEHNRALHGSTHFPYKLPPSPKETQKGTSVVLEQVQYNNEQPLTLEHTMYSEHGSPPSPSNLNSSGTLQDSPLPPTPKCEGCAVAGADIFFIRSESPSTFNPDAFAAILDMASPPPLAKEEDDYFSTHYFDYPDDVVA